MYYVVNLKRKKDHFSVAITTGVAEGRMQDEINDKAVVEIMIREQASWWADGCYSESTKL